MQCACDHGKPQWETLSPLIAEDTKVKSYTKFHIAITTPQYDCGLPVEGYEFVCIALNARLSLESRAMGHIVQLYLPAYQNYMSKALEFLGRAFLMKPPTWISIQSACARANIVTPIHEQIPSTDRVYHLSCLRSFEQDASTRVLAQLPLSLSSM
jgi:hypothetical protein